MRAIAFLSFAFCILVDSAANADGIPSVQPNPLSCTLEMPDISRNRVSCGNYKAPNSEFKCAREVADYTVAGLTLPTGRPGAPSLIKRRGDTLSLPFNLADRLSTGNYQVGLKLRKGSQILDMKFPFSVDNVPPGVEVTKLRGNTIIKVADTTSTISEVTVIVPERKGFLANDVNDIAVSTPNNNLLRDQKYTIRALLPDDALIHVSDETGNSAFYQVDGSNPDSQVEKYLTFLEKRLLKTTSAAAVQGHPVEGPILPVVYTYSSSLSSSELATNTKKVVDVSNHALRRLSDFFLANGVKVPGFPESALANMRFYIREVGSDKVDRIHLSGSQIVTDETLSFGSFLADFGTEVDTGNASSLNIHPVSNNEDILSVPSSLSLLFGNAAAGVSERALRDRVVMFYDKVSDSYSTDDDGDGNFVTVVNPDVLGLYLNSLPMIFIELESFSSIRKGSDVLIHELMHSFGYPHVLQRPEPSEEFLTIGNIMEPVSKEYGLGKISRSQAVLLAARIWGTPSEAASATGRTSEKKTYATGSEFWLLRELCGSGQVLSVPSIAQPFNRTKSPTVIGDAQSDLPRPPAFSERLRSLECPSGELSRGNHFDFQAMKSSDWRFIFPGSIDTSSGLPIVAGGLSTPLVVFKRLQPNAPSELAFIGISLGMLHPNLMLSLYRAPEFANMPEYWPKVAEARMAKLELPPGVSADSKVFVLQNFLQSQMVVSDVVEHPLSSSFWRRMVDLGDEHTFSTLVAIGYKPAELEPITPRDSRVWHPDNPLTLGE